MIILSLDSGLEKTGYSIFNKSNLNKFFYITSGVINTDKSKKIEYRIYDIYSFLEKIIKKFYPKKVILERLFFFKNKKTIVSVSQTQGVILLLCAINKIPVFFLTPLQIKQSITGYGRSDKKSVQKMLSMLIEPRNTFSQDDEADAVACGLAYCYINENLLE